MHVQTLQQRVGAIVTEAAAAITRENNRPVPAIAFHYWADEALALYQRNLERARRMSYLALRAVEHDLQRSFGLDRDVLAATHPQQLKSIVDGQLAAYLGDGIDKLQMTQHKTVLSLCKDILRLPERNGEPDCDTGVRSQRQFRRDPVSARQFVVPERRVRRAGRAVHARHGVGGVEQRCAENLAQVDAHFVADNIRSPRSKCSSRSARRSTARACTTHVDEVGGPRRTGTLRSSNNFLLDGTCPSSAGPGVHAPRKSTRSRTAMTGSRAATSPGTNAVADLAGRGLYGDYRLVVLPSALDIISPIPAICATSRSTRLRLGRRFAGQRRRSCATAHHRAARRRRAVITSSSNSVGAAAMVARPAATQGSVARLPAAATAGWHFAAWSGACSGLARRATVSMEAPAPGVRPSSTTIRA